MTSDEELMAVLPDRIREAYDSIRHPINLCNGEVGGMCNADIDEVSAVFFNDDIMKRFDEFQRLVRIDASLHQAPVVTEALDTTGDARVNSSGTVIDRASPTWPVGAEMVAPVSVSSDEEEDLGEGDDNNYDDIHAAMVNARPDEISWTTLSGIHRPPPMGDGEREVYFQPDKEAEEEEEAEAEEEAEEEADEEAEDGGAAADILRARINGKVVDELKMLVLGSRSNRLKRKAA